MSITVLYSKYVCKMVAKSDRRVKLLPENVEINFLKHNLRALSYDINNLESALKFALHRRVRG